MPLKSFISPPNAQEISKERRWKDTPVGPLGMSIDVKDPRSVDLNLVVSHPNLVVSHPNLVVSLPHEQPILLDVTSSFSK